MAVPWPYLQRGKQLAQLPLVPCKLLAAPGVGIRTRLVRVRVRVCGQGKVRVRVKVRVSLRAGWQ